MVTPEIDSPAMQRFDPSKMKAARQAVGLTQADAAKRCGMTQGRWSEIELGKRSEITVDTLSNIADGLGCLVQDLMTAPRRKGRS